MPVYQEAPLYLEWRDSIMPASKANQRAVNKYKRNNYDRIEITVPKGKREVFQAHAAAHGESVNAFISRAIAEAIERDNSAQKPTKRTDGGGATPIPPDAETPSEAAQEAGQGA